MLKISQNKICSIKVGRNQEEAKINSNLVRDEVINTEGFLPKNSPISQYFPKNSSFLGKTSN